MKWYAVYIQGKNEPDDTFNSYIEAAIYADQLKKKGLRAYVKRV